MSRITNVEVRFSRQVKPADYENKSAEAKIMVSADDEENLDASAKLDELFSLAMDKVYTAVGLKKPEEKTAAPETKTEEKPAEEQPKKKRGRPRKSDSQKKAEAEAKEEKSAAAMEESSATVEEPAEEKPAETQTEEKPSAASMDDLQMDGDGESEPVEKSINVGEMQTAVGQTIKRLTTDGVESPNDKIKAYLSEWQTKCDINPGKPMPLGKILEGIPEDKRQEFVDGLEAIGQ